MGRSSRHLLGYRIPMLDGKDTLWKDTCGHQTLLLAEKQLRQRRISAPRAWIIWHFESSQIFFWLILWSSGIIWVNWEKACRAFIPILQRIIFEHVLKTKIKHLTGRLKPLCGWVMECSGKAQINLNIHSSPRPRPYLGSTCSGKDAKKFW